MIQNCFLSPVSPDSSKCTMDLFCKLWCSLIFAVLFFHFAVNAQSPTYTEMEKAALVKFRASVKNDLYLDYMNSDIYLIRWLRAKHFDQTAAREMLLKALKWRKEFKVDGIEKEELYERKSKLFYIDGTDNRGSLVLSVLIARFDTRSFIVQGKRDILVRFYIQCLEAIEQGIYRQSGIIGNGTVQGPESHLVTAIFDAHSYNLRSHACLSCLGVYVQFFEMMENFYPGYVKQFLIINAPRIIVPLVELVKPLMSKMTREGFKVFGPDKAEWRKAIVGKIAKADQLHLQFGGTKSD